MATASEIAIAIRTALANRASSGSAGIVSVTIDGISTTYNFDQAVKELQFWEKRAKGKRRFSNSFDLRNY